MKLINMEYQRFYSSFWRGIGGGAAPECDECEGDEYFDDTMDVDSFDSNEMDVEMSGLPTPLLLSKGIPAGSARDKRLQECIDMISFVKSKELLAKGINPTGDDAHYDSDSSIDLDTMGNEEEFEKVMNSSKVVNFGIRQWCMFKEIDGLECRREETLHHTTDIETSVIKKAVDLEESLISKSCEKKENKKDTIIFGRVWFEDSFNISPVEKCNKFTSLKKDLARKMHSWTVFKMTFLQKCQSKKIGWDVLTRKKIGSIQLG